MDGIFAAVREITQRGVKQIRRRITLLLFLTAVCGSLQAKIYLLLDEKLKKSGVEQMLYKFIPLTNAAEVELNFVRDFMKEGNAAAFAKKLQEQDRAIYIGADRWPDDGYISRLTQGRDWFAMLGKVSFLIENNAPSYAPMPKGLFPRFEIWKKYSELTGTKYLGYFPTHYLDVNPVTLKDSEWPSFTCVHESGRELVPGPRSPLSVGKNRFQLSFRNAKQLDFAGNLVCINTPRADAVFEIHSAKTDVLLEAAPGRFSPWNEAQPLRIKITSTRQISAPLDLQIIPEVNATPVDFFFQGDKISCEAKRCRKKDAKFLMPLMRDFAHEYELAIRAGGEGYFRGTLRLLAGEIEVARTEVKFTPHSWVAEIIYALENPSEYKSAFLLIFILTIAGVGCIVALVMALKKLGTALSLRQKAELPRQNSAITAIVRGTVYRLTASQNPFGCELADFGGIVDVAVGQDAVQITYGGGATHSAPLENFRYRLPDGYVVAVKSLRDGTILLEVTGMGLLTTSMIPSQTPGLPAQSG